MGKSDQGLINILAILLAGNQKVKNEEVFAVNEKGTPCRSKMEFLYSCYDMVNVLLEEIK